MTGKLPDVTDANFQADVLEADGPVLVDFWAPWCGPCRVVHPILEEMAAERDGELRIVSLNVDDNQQTAGRYEVLSIPTLILFRDGAEAKRVVGALPKRRLEAELEPALRLDSAPMRRLDRTSRFVVVALVASRCTRRRRAGARGSTTVKLSATTSSPDEDDDLEGHEGQVQVGRQRQAQRRQEERPRRRLLLRRSPTRPGSTSPRSSRRRDLQADLHDPREHEAEGQRQLRPRSARSTPIRSSRPSIVAAAAGPSPS